jgi:hypothetical protein
MYRPSLLLPSFPTLTGFVASAEALTKSQFLTSIPTHTSKYEEEPSANSPEPQ